MRRSSRCTLGVLRVAIRQVGWAALIGVSLVAAAARAALITITEAGTVTSSSGFGSVPLAGQPFTLTTTFDPTAVQACPGNPSFTCFESGATTFNSGPYQGTSGFPNVAYDSDSGFSWGPATGLRIVTSGFGSLTVSGGPPEATLLSSNTDSITSDTAIPNPLTVSGTFSTTIPPPTNMFSYTASGIFRAVGTISNLTISGIPPTPQTVYLNFDQATAVLTSKLFNGGQATFAKAAANIPAGDIPDIVSAVQKEYAAYNVNFTTTPPTSGSYFTLYVGGTSASLLNNLTTPERDRVSNIDENTAGVARINLNVNSSPTFSLPMSSGLVFSDQAVIAADSTHQLLEQVIEHETGHLLGLQHVLPSKELMYPIAGIGSTQIGGIASTAGVFHGIVVPDFGTQDSNGVLLCNVGASSGQKTCGSTVITLQDKLRILWHDLGSSVFDAELVLTYGDDDALPIVLDLGDISNGTLTNLDISLFGNGEAYIMGSSIPGGPADIYSGNLAGLSEEDATTAALAQPFVDNDGNLISVDWKLFELTGGVFTPFGEASLSDASLSSVPEPSTMAMLVTGVVVLGWRKRRLS